MVGSFFAGVGAVVRGAGRIARDAELRRLALAPLVITALVYLLFAAIAAYFAGDVLGYVWARPAAGAGRLAWSVLVPFVALAMLAPLVLLFSTVAGAVGGPFYDRMAIRVLEGRGLAATDPGFVAGTLPDVLRSLVFAAVGLVCALLALIPAIGLVFGVLAALVTWVGFGASAINPALTVSGLGVKGRIRYAIDRPCLMAGLGVVVAFSLFVPLLGLVSLPAAVVGASELYAKDS